MLILANVPEEETAATNEETHPQAVLQNKKFGILRYDAEQSLRIKELIEEYSGLVVNNHEQADHIIVPLTYNKKISINPNEVSLKSLIKINECNKLFILFNL